MRAPELSVIVAAVDVESSIDACLASIADATTSLDAETVVVDASTDATRQRLAAYPGVRVLHAAPGTLVPVLWSIGVDAARGRLVALTIGQCRVAPTWAARMVSGLQPGVGGAGGAIELAAGTSARVAAWFLLRYSAFIGQRWRGGVVRGDIAGDNAIYRRDDLLRCGVSRSSGLWEVEVHRQLRRLGLELVAVTDAAASVMNAPQARRTLRDRFRHGRHFGATRVGRGEPQPRVIGRAPFVPLVLTWRAVRRVWADRVYRRRAVMAVPYMLIFASAWALGEAVGAWSGAERAPLDVTAEVSADG